LCTLATLESEDILKFDKRLYKAQVKNGCYAERFRGVLGMQIFSAIYAMYGGRNPPLPYIFNGGRTAMSAKIMCPTYSGMKVLYTTNRS
jgi:hypothetical protein